MRHRAKLRRAGLILDLQSEIAGRAISATIRYMGGATLAEIARVHGCTPQTVANDLERTNTARRPGGRVRGKKIGPYRKRRTG